MLEFNLIGAAMVAATVLVHAAGTFWWMHRLAVFSAGRNLSLPSLSGLWMLIGTALVLVALHTIEVVLWAVTYRTFLPAGELPTFEAALYFSFVTFTTLGYGDITLGEGRRLLSGIEAMNGILLFGWTTATFFSVVQHIWRTSSGAAGR